MELQRQTTPPPAAAHTHTFSMCFCKPPNSLLRTFSSFRSLTGFSISPSQLIRYPSISSDTGSGQGGGGKSQRGCGWEPTAERLLGSQAWYLARKPSTENSLHVDVSGFQIKHLKNVFIFTRGCRSATDLTLCKAFLQLPSWGRTRVKDWSPAIQVLFLTLEHSQGLYSEPPHRHWGLKPHQS